jgi:hypothetical protein
VGGRVFVVVQVQEACVAGGRRKRKMDCCKEADGEEVVEEDSCFQGSSLGCRLARVR